MAETVKNISETINIGPDCAESFLPLHLPEAEKLRSAGIRLAGVSNLRPPYEMGRVSADTNVLLCTTAGKARWWTESDSGEILPNSLWWFPAGLTYGYEIVSKRWDMHWFHLDSSGDWGICSIGPLMAGSVAVELQQAMDAFISTQHSVPAQSTRLVSLYSELISCWLGRLLGVEAVVSDPLAENLSRLWQEVSANLGRKWTVDMLAEKIFVSTSHLHRLTQKYCNNSPMSQVNMLRMQRAEALLAGTNFSLGDIAASLAYDTAFAFSKAFKKYSGVSPRDFRRSKRAAD